MEENSSRGELVSYLYQVRRGEAKVGGLETPHITSLIMSKGGHRTEYGGGEAKATGLARDM